MAFSYGEIGRVLHAARRRQSWIVLLAGLTLALAGAAVALLLGALALRLGSGPLTRPLALAGASLAAAGALGWSAWELLRTALRTSDAVRMIGSAEPGLGSELLTSVELHRDYGELAQSQRFSMALVDEQIARTAGRVTSLDLGRLISSSPARKGALALGAVLLLHLLGFGLAGRPLALAYGKLARGEVRPQAGPKVEPITGDIELTYLYPAYMGRPQKTLSGTGGEVNAPKGTEVRFKTRADRPVKEAEIAVSTGSDAAAAKHHALKVANQRDLSGSFVAPRPGRP